MRIPCPVCGLRDQSEFVASGDASVALPALEASTDDWFEAVYLRTNPAGRHLEHWHHLAGCRLWLTVERDTRTHEILSVRLPARWRGAGPDAVRANGR